MLMALSGLQHTLGPVENTPLLRSFVQSLAADPLLAVVLAALLTWGCHSSVAMVLVVGSLAASHVIGATETLALVLGANVGGALPALMHTSTPEARRLPLGNLLVRLIGVLLMLPWLKPVTEFMVRFIPGEARLAVNFHLLFNMVLAAIFLFAVKRTRPLAAVLAARPAASGRSGPTPVPRTRGRRRGQRCTGECGA